MDDATRTAHMADMERIRFLENKVLDQQDKVLDRLVSIDKHLVELNGSVARNTRDVAVAKIVADTLQAEYVEHCVALAVLQERDKFREEQIGEQKGDTKDVLAKVFDLSWKLGSLVGAVGLLTKLANVW